MAKYWPGRIPRLVFRSSRHSRPGQSSVGHGRHPSRMRSADGARRLFEQELIKTQVQVEHVLAEREHTRQGNEGCTRLPRYDECVDECVPSAEPTAIRPPG